MKSLFPVLAGWLLVALVPESRAAEALVRREWTVDGVKREALLHVPAAAKTAVPVVFVFHGHGGSMRQAAWSYPVHELWPEALVVYMEGLPTPGRLTDRAGDRNGWQAGPGAQGDRDLKFFDAVLRDLRQENPVDDRRIYAMGHSNGGGFTYLLWAMRGGVFAAYGPSAAVIGRDYPPLRPTPVIHVAGEKDPLVKFAWQQRMIGWLLRINQCDPHGQPAGKYLTLYSSKTGTPVMTYIHPGPHTFPPEATVQVVNFFKAHPRG